MTDQHDLKLGEWQTEEKRLPTITLNDQGTPTIGERVVKQRYAYSQLIPQAACGPDEHDFALVDGGRPQNGHVLVKPAAARSAASSSPRSTRCATCG